MHLRIIVIALALLAAASFAAADTGFSEAAARLDGEWHGQAFVLKIDARRAQASVDPTRPFEWEHFLVKEVRGDDIVFSIGADLYEAKVDADILTLTSTSFRGERVLFRTTGDATSNLRGSTDDP